MAATTKIVLADDHPIVREGFIRIIEADRAFSILGEAGNGEDALNLIADKKPDIAVLDISMPGLNGLEIARLLRDRGELTRIVVLTMYRDREYFDDAMALGIRGYILKDCAATDLLQCLKTIRNNGHYISPTLSGYLIQPKPQQNKPKIQSPLARLTQTEKSVLQLIAQNKTSKEIAKELFISYRTVQNHRFNMCRKLDLKGHHKLLHFAINNG